MKAIPRPPTRDRVLAHAVMLSTVLAAGACSSNGTGPSSPGSDVPRVGVLGDGVDVAGSGTDTGEGTASVFACRGPTDCPHGRCILGDRPLIEPPPTQGPLGVCFTICSVPLGSDIGSIAVKGCPRNHTCLVGGGVGICVRPCSIDADCPRDRQVQLRCTHVTGLRGNWCATIASSGAAPAPTSEPPAAETPPAPAPAPNPTPR